jgi:hypothetical protein
MRGHSEETLMSEEDEFTNVDWACAHSRLFDATAALVGIIARGLPPAERHEKLTAYRETLTKRAAVPFITDEGEVGGRGIDLTVKLLGAVFDHALKDASLN